MSVRLRHRHGRRSGFTLVETMIALVGMVALGYSLVVILGVGSRSERTVLRVAAEDQGYRKSVKMVTDELRASSDSTVTIQTLADGNHQVRFQLPIVAGGVTTWGVHDPTLSSIPAEQDKPGWSIRYTVRSVPAGNGTTVRQLVRQVLDNALVVQKERVLETGLRTGAQVPPGFRVVKTGLVWEVTLTTQGLVASKTVLGAVFHVRTRN